MKLFFGARLRTFLNTSKTNLRGKMKNDPTFNVNVKDEKSYMFVQSGCMETSLIK